MPPDALKAQDVLVALKLAAAIDVDWSFTKLAYALGISVGGTHNAVTRLLSSGLLKDKGGQAHVVPRRLVDFLIHGVPAAFYPVKKGISRGVPTSTAGPSLSAKFPLGEGEIPTVWPVANGRVQGVALQPIYETAPRAAAADAKLYDLLTLVDAIRVGRAKERRAAAELLEARVVGERGKKDGKEGAEDDVE